MAAVRKPLMGPMDGPTCGVDTDFRVYKHVSNSWDSQRRRERDKPICAKKNVVILGRGGGDQVQKPGEAFKGFLQILIFRRISVSTTLS